MIHHLSFLVSQSTLSSSKLSLFSCASSCQSRHNYSSARSIWDGTILSQSSHHNTLSSSRLSSRASQAILVIILVVQRSIWDGSKVFMEGFAISSPQIAKSKIQKNYKSSPVERLLEILRKKRIILWLIQNIMIVISLILRCCETLWAS